MNLYDLYEKYCLRLCSERKKYEPYYQEEIGICHNCRNSKVNKSELERLFTNIKVFMDNGYLLEYLNSILPENEDVVTLAELNEMMEDERSYWA